MKSSHHCGILNIHISLHTKFHLSRTTLIFSPNLPKKGISGIKQKKMSITLAFCIFKLIQVPNFSLKWQFCVAGPRLPKKRYFWSKAEKVRIPIEICIFKSASVRTFSLKLQFPFLGQNWPNNGISSLKRKKWTSLLNSAYSS